MTSVLNRVCVDVESEPRLIPVTKEVFRLKSTNREDGARLDVKAKDFWRRGQTAFFDIRVTRVNAKSNTNKTSAEIFKQHEEEKKRNYLSAYLRSRKVASPPWFLERTEVWAMTVKSSLQTCQRNLRKDKMKSTRT